MILEKALLPLNSFPSIAWFTVFLKASEIWIEAQENYQKQTFRNRYQILTAQGIKGLTIPVKKNRLQLVTDTTIDNKHNWQRQHWKTLCTSYGKSPFFDYLADELQPIFFKQWQYIFDLNMEVLTICQKILKFHKQINLTKLYQKTTDIRLKDFRRCLSEPNDITMSKIVNFKDYTQVFGNKFVENLSILDLLFNEGLNSVKILEMNKLNVS